MKLINKLLRRMPLSDAEPLQFLCLLKHTVFVKRVLTIIMIWYLV